LIKKNYFRQRKGSRNLTFCAKETVWRLLFLDEKFGKFLSRFQVLPTTTNWLFGNIWRHIKIYLIKQKIPQTDRGQQRILPFVLKRQCGECFFVNQPFSDGSRCEFHQVVLTCMITFTVDYALVELENSRLQSGSESFRKYRSALFYGTMVSGMIFFKSIPVYKIKF
jgi:hypothetical protein